MTNGRAWLSADAIVREDRVTLARLGAPLLYAYDANTFYRRLRGVRLIPPMGPTDALIIRPCKAIHTYGLIQPIDIVFLNLHGKILKMDTLKPRSLYACFGASVAVEMAQGTARRISLGVGQVLIPKNGAWR
jgi:uncharacterized membrane protein (UPF0127 family)